MLTQAQLKRRKLLKATATLALTAAHTNGAFANKKWPDRPIRLVEAFTPGGSSDVVARAVSTKLGEKLGQPVVVENKTGAGGTLGTDAVAKAAADGNTLLLATTAMTTNSALGKKLPYDFVRDLQPIGQIAASSLVVVVAEKSPIRNLQDLVQWAHKNPDSINFGSSGVGSMSHLGMELLSSATKIKLMHVPYQGTSVAMTDLMAGRLDLILASYATVANLLETGKLRGIVISSEKRSPFAPDIQTAAEAGYPDFHIEFWWGIMGPRNIPANLVQQINESLNWVLTQHDMQKTLTQLAAVAQPETPDNFGKLITEDLSRWKAIVKKAGLQPS